MGSYQAVVRAQLAASEQVRIPHERARWYAELGDLDNALRSLDEAIRVRDIFAPFVENISEFAAMRHDPRWPAVRARLGLPVTLKP